MKKFRLLSAFLAVAMTFGMLPAMAVDATGNGSLVPEYNEETGKTSIDYLDAAFTTHESKLATMTKYLEKNGMELYVEPISGEVAYVNTKTGQILFSNPYDVSNSGATKSIRQELLSQIIINYTDNGKQIEMNSFVEACQRGQILVKKIKNGVRVEYTMGRSETRKLVPKLITKERFETLILNNIPDGDEKDNLLVYYSYYDANDPTLSESLRQEYKALFPICETEPVYSIDAFASDRELTEDIETVIRKYCPDYTYETLEEDHAITGYVGTDKAPVLFRLALEYSLDDSGDLDVRLPANGIRFDESVYQLDSISMLPWFGAGSSEYAGYTFIPDGSGALIRFEDVGTKPLTLTSKIYGQDYAYQEVSGNNKEVMRMPVYGVVESSVVMDEELAEEMEFLGATKQSRGFLAILEEGDSLAEISTEHGGNLHKYNSVYTTFYPRPKDTYNLAETISVGANSEYTIVSERKYTGSYRIKYIMLTAAEDAEKAGLDSYYVDSYVGMAKAYRDYLIANGTLSELAEDDVKKDNIPLYIESFGAIETTERVFSIPVTVLKPLTTFDDLKTMYESLEASGITNINYKLTGFANGGMYSTIPNTVDIEKSVGGEKGFTELMEYSNEVSGKGGNLGIFLDFDFAYKTYSKMFDGFSAKKHLVKAMDNRYSVKQEYKAAWQEFVRSDAMVVTPSVFGEFFEGLKDDFNALNPMGISVATLGTDLNSDFDKKEPYNREDSKGFTTDTLASIEESYSNVMLAGGNAYALPYADHILDVALESSRYSRASESVPFTGMVLHGCVNFTGSAINMAGDTQYELLKAIENGASLYFTLSMQNTSLLKEHSELSRYYSISYDIWEEELVEIYNELNDVTADLQTKQIVDHEFLIGSRIPTAEELAADAAEIEEAKRLEAEAAAHEAEKKEIEKKRKEYEASLRGETIKSDEAPSSSSSSKLDLLTKDEEDLTSFKYICDDGRIVKVTYEGGKAFILNYNNFEVEVENDGKTYTVAALDFVVID